jgi:DNA-binding transcriptional regulator YhcF (GntR family)
MELFVNPSGELSLYRQIMRQITEAIAGGRLRPGEKLASHRELSEQLVIAPLTVKKAYDELEALGYIETQRGRGTFVCAQLPRTDPADQEDQIREAARKLLSQAYLAGMRLSTVERILKDADHELTVGKPQNFPEEKVKR